MHTDSGMTGISLSGYMPYMTVASLEMSDEPDLNRIKVMLVEKKRSNKWLAEQLGKDPATVSKWCTNTSQPTLETLLKIAELLEVNYTELVRAESVICPRN